MKTRLKTRIFSVDSSTRTRATTLLLFRVLVSLSMINTHGIKKILHFEDTVKNIPDPLQLGGEISTVMAITANVIAPLFVIAGFATRIAVLPILSITLTGFFIVHKADPWAVKDVPLLYSLAYLLILFLGPGKYSLDHKFHNTL